MTARDRRKLLWLLIAVTVGGGLTYAGVPPQLAWTLGTQAATQVEGTIIAPDPEAAP